MWWIVGVVAVVVLVATYVTWTAARVDRLHVRAAAAYGALDAHLVRRAATAIELADQLARAELRQAARAALEAVAEDREPTENDLTRELRRLPLDGEPPVAAMVAASRQVALTRQVHNDSVRDALAVRRQPLVRLLRLARRHPQPRYFDVDDPMLDPGVPA
jgi:Tfp pilus assembly protein PilO